MTALQIGSRDSQNRQDVVFAGRRSPRPTVLIVEDHEDTRFLLKTLIEMRGFTVFEVADGEQAIKTAERERPDLILMDAALPRMDGFSATRLLRRNTTLGDTPIVFVSGHAGLDYRLAAFAAGCDEYIVKPFGARHLNRILDTYLAPPRGTAETAP